MEFLKLEFLKFDSALWQRVVSLLEYDPAAPLTLATGFFLFALFVFALGYIIIKRRPNLRTWYVTLFSLYFYYKLSGLYLLLLCGVALSDYIIGRRVARCREEDKSTRGWVALSVTINLAILIYFKATGFFVGLLDNLYADGVLNFEGVAVPAGVSFFVFQSIAYVVDISRGTIKPLKRFMDYLFLLSFFPKMFLGPLVKAKEFIPQIEAREVNVSREDFGRAVTLIAGGLLKYAVIASTLGALFVNPAFKGELGDSGVVALLAIYGFTLQIYCDFSGYSDIAVGVALMMGFRLPDNFDAPYKSATITEFWRRWHISLSTWLKEYLYIALGGNRRGSFRTVDDKGTLFGHEREVAHEDGGLFYFTGELVGETDVHLEGSGVVYVAFLAFFDRVLRLGIKRITDKVDEQVAGVVRNRGNIFEDFHKSLFKKPVE